MSAHDGKCGHCRSRKEQKALDDKFSPVRLYGRDAWLREFVDELPNG